MYDPRELQHLNIEEVFEAYCRLKFLTTLNNISSRCRKDDIEFDISLDDLSPFPLRCPVLGIPIDYFKKKKGPANSSPSIDRIDPSKGYIRGNVRVVSQKANRLKQDSCKEETIRVLAYQLDIPYSVLKANLALYI